MSSSPTFGTAGYIIREAMTEAGKLAKGDDPDPEDIAGWLNRLGDMANLWMTQGIKLFTWQDTTITLVQTVAQYQIGPQAVNTPAQPALVQPLPMMIESAYYIDSSFNQRPLYSISWDEWTRLSNRSNLGPPNSYFVDRQATVLNLWLWLSPDAFTASNGTVHAIVRKAATLPLQTTSATGFPPEWSLGLIWGLADEKCKGAPEAVQARCASRAAIYRQMLEEFDIEDTSTYLQPDMRGMVQSRFL